MAWYNEKFECPNPPDCAANQMVPPSEWNAMVAYLKDKIRGMLFTVPGAGDDGKYIKYVHGTPGFVLDTPAGGGDMLKSVYDIGDNGIVDNSEKVDGCDAGIATGNVFKIPAGIAQGDIFYVDASGNIVRLAAGTNGHFLKTQGAAANPIWAAGVGGVDTWLELTDTPGSFATHAGKLPKVNAGATALEFGMLESDIFKRDGSVTMTGDLDGGVNAVKIERVYRDSLTGFLGLYGDNHAVCPSGFQIMGINSASYSGDIVTYTQNVAKNTWLEVMRITGCSDSPETQFSYNIKIDTINEKTAAAGVTIDNCLIKDGKAANSEKVDGCDAGIATGNVFKIPAGIAQGDIFYVNASGNIVRLAAGTNGHFLKTQGAAANPIWAAGVGGVDTWLELTDTPSAFTGQAGKYPKVNAGETALEFGTPSGEGDVVGPASSVNNRIVLFDGVTGKLIKDAGKLLANTANNIPILDGSALLPLAQIPATLTGKDADTVDGIEGVAIFKKDGSVAMTGDLDGGVNAVKIERVYRDSLTGFLGLYGDNHAVCPSGFQIMGINSASYSGDIVTYTQNVAKNTWLEVMRITGCSDSPETQFSYNIKIDTINEKTAAAGVTIDGCLIKDGLATAPISSTLTVAANDAKNKPRSDYQCDASADQTEINNAINALPT